jgi:hypothetical protein
MTTPRVLSTAAPNLRSTAWRHDKVTSLPDAIGSAPPGPPRTFFQAETPVTLGHQPSKTKFYCGKLQTKRETNKEKQKENLDGRSP